jgi:hypothetical protein
MYCKTFNTQINHSIECFKQIRSIVMSKLMNSIYDVMLLYRIYILIFVILFIRCYHNVNYQFFLDNLYYCDVFIG